MAYLLPKNRVSNFIWVSWLQVVLCAFLLTISRLIFLYLEGDHLLMKSLHSDFFETLFIGLRFDLRVATIAFAPMLLLGLILTTTKYRSLMPKLVAFYSFVIYFFSVSASIGNYFYFKTYNNHFDIFVFGFLEDDTLNVMTSMWLEYPLINAMITSLLISALLTVIIVKALRYFAIKQQKPQTRYSIILLVGLTLLVTLFLARGSLGTFPLKQYHANVSHYEVFNKSTPNALLALSWAHKKHQQDAHFVAVSKAQYQNQVQAVVRQASPRYKTEKNVQLAQSPPNVIFALMESMGSNLLVADEEGKTDLLGALRKPFAEDFLFNRFLSGTNTTIDSIALMLFHSNVNTISQGKAQNKLLSGSAFLPYKRSGYKVVYITGGSATWRNLNHYMLRQGVDEFYAENDIIDAFPEAAESAGTWGVPDAYTFKFAEDIINKSTQPVMIMLLTQTNHSPYNTPAEYAVKPLTVTAKLMNKISLSESKSREILSTYQYAANALGEFIQSIKANNENTIVAATGDHRVRSFAIDYPVDLGSAYSVPFYLYIPKDILASTSYRYDALRVGSHRDIFPTLYAFSLSEREYTSLGGRNLLAQEDIAQAVAFNDNVLLTPQGVINTSTPTLLYPWLNSTTLQVSSVPITSLMPELAKEYNHLQTLYINSQVKGFLPYSELARLTVTPE